MQGYIIGDQSRTVNYFLQGLAYYEKHILPRREKRIKKIQKLKGNQKKKAEQAADNLVYYVITTELQSLNWLKYQLNEYGQNKRVCVIVLDYYKESFVTTSYIKAYLERGNKDIHIQKIIGVEFQDNDRIIQIEDTYNDTYSYASLSRKYRKQLHRITMNRLVLMEEEVLEAYYANRFLV